MTRNQDVNMTMRIFSANVVIVFVKVIDDVYSFIIDKCEKIDDEKL